jgi:hypothetical protein
MYSIFCLQFLRSGIHVAVYICHSQALSYLNTSSKFEIEMLWMKKGTIYWLLLPCISDILIFRRNISLPSSGSNSKPNKKEAIEADEVNCFCLHFKEWIKILPPASTGFLVGLLFILEAEGNVLFLQIFWLRPNYTALYLISQYIS